METFQRNANRGSISTGYDIDHSMKCQANSGNEWFYRDNPTAGDKKTFTFSFWHKRSQLTGFEADNYLMSQGSNARFHFAGHTLRFMFDGNSTEMEASGKLRDTNAWYHIVLAIDTTQGTNTNRVKAYVNGVQYPFNNSDWPSQNQESSWMSGTDMYFNTRDGDGSYDNSGYWAEIAVVDGQQLAPTDFGEFDEDSGIWKPKDLSSITFGSEGFWWNFSNSSSLGADSSGNSNTATFNNLTTADLATDTPTNNFCTWSPLWEFKSDGTISQGGTQVEWGGSVWKGVKGSIAVSRGRWYWEIKAANATGDTWNNNLFGFQATQEDRPMVSNNPSKIGPAVYIGYSTGNYYYRVDGTQTGDSSTGWDSGGAWDSNDTFGFALDLESSTKKFILHRNGSAVNGSGTDLVSAFQSEQFFSTFATAYNGDTQFLNWGGYTVNTISSAASDANGYGTFEYAPPSGYYAICTKNLAEFG